MSWIGVISLAMLPLWLVLVHAILQRLPRLRAVPRQSVSLLACVSVVAAVTMGALVEEPESAAFMLLCSLLVAHVYFHIFNMSETARRIRILLDLRAGHPPGSYGADHMIERRLERLLALGQIELVDGKYRARRTWFGLAARLVHLHEQLLFPRRGRK